MTSFTIHNSDSAPEDSKPFLDKAQAKFGMVPNLIGLLAEAPAAVEAYQTLGGLFGKTSFSPTERNLIWLTINYENDCTYCMAAHTAIAKTENVDAEVISALRNNTPLADARLEALRTFTSAIVTSRGWVGGPALEAFLGAGYSKQNVFEVLVGVSHKVFSNYANHIAETPLDAPFEKFAWQKSVVSEA